MPRFLRQAVALLAALAVTVTACGSDGGNSTDSASTQTELGAQVYAEACASCHGADLRGTDKGPSQLSIVYEPNHHSDASFRNAIANGAPQHHFDFGDMEPVEGLTEADVEAVIAFVRSEQQRLGFED